ncbi:MAG TPA: GerMN domain-containing protein [Actinomycetota bacterium]|nr:GerMN domain-containing protein [Actinomycetota bacterium]
MRRRVLVAATLCLAVACGGTSGPVTIPTSDVPFPLTREAAQPEVTSTVGRILVFFVLDGRLSAVTRTAEAGDTPTEASMRALLGGPNSREQERGLTTNLPASTRLLDITIADRVAVADLSAEFQAPAEPDAITLRIAQVVWTLTQLPGVEAVRFAVDGNLISVATDDGQSVDRPVSRADYDQFAPLGR